ncbi:MAG: NAD+ synthase [Armatimonadetes bacterium]|nr:NAD+ synthase [Armatimonadota bacterium]
MSEFALDWEAVADRIADFVRGQIHGAGRERGIIGLSGGIDSAVSAYMAVRALGPENFTAFMMPYRTSSPSSLEDALLVVGELGVEHEVIEITPMVDAYFEMFPDADQIRRANMMARQRMAVLYDQSERHDALVVGTGNRTEALLGYTTLWGDMASAFNPIGDLYKTQVRALARHIGVPERIITKPPTGDLWVGQTDEGELGFTYADADQVLTRAVDRGMSADEIEAEGFDGELVKAVLARMAATEFKRRLPPAPPVRDLKA